MSQILAKACCLSLCLTVSAPVIAGNRKGPGAARLLSPSAPSPSAKALEDTLASDSAADTRKPNIVYIMLDDAGYGDIGAFGGALIRTPHIDKLAAQGRRLTQFYANAAVCSPTRVAVLTGRYPQRLGFWTASPENVALRGIPAQTQTLPEMLRQQGYVTGHVGKWHIGTRKPQHLPPGVGFDFSVRAIENVGTTYYGRRLIVNESDLIDSTKHLTEDFTDRAISFVQKNRNKPFFLNLWYLAPHTQWESPPEWIERYDSKSLDRRVAQYAALLSFVDHQIGRLVSAIDAAGLARRTLIVVTSDNGPRRLDLDSTAGYRGNKGKVFEGGIRVPAVARWPGTIPAGSVGTSVGLTMDLMPTFADIAGTRVLASDGVSLVPMLIEGKTLVRSQPIHWENKRGLRDYGKRPHDWWNSYAVRGGDLKLVHDRGGSQLFDLARDPFERTDLAAARPEQVSRLEAAHEEWRQQVGVIQYAIGHLVRKVTVSNDRSRLMTFDGGHVVLEENDLFDTSVADFSFSTEVELASETLERFSVLATKEGSWQLGVEPGGRLRLLLHGDQGTPCTILSRTRLHPDRWYHVSFTVYGFVGQKNHMRLYVDGRLEGQIWEFLVGDSSDHQITLSSEDRPFVGRMRNTRFYSKPLWEGKALWEGATP